MPQRRTSILRAFAFLMILSRFCFIRAGGIPRRRSLAPRDRKSTRLNSSHWLISYAVFCLKKKTIGRLDAIRGYSQGDLHLWFAFSSFSANAALYDNVIRYGNNQDATSLAVEALVAAMRRV